MRYAAASVAYSRHYSSSLH